MKERQQNSTSISRRRVSRLLTFLLFFYLCVDVSVLEYFCGNPSLGIASYRQVVEINPQLAKASQTVFAQNSIDDSRSSRHDQEPDIPIDGDD